MFGKKTDWSTVLIGAALMSPLDEAAFTAATGGAGALAAPAQGPITFVVGGLMVLHGLGVVK